MKKLLGPLYDAVFGYADVCEVRLALGCRAVVQTIRGTHRLPAVVTQTMLNDALAVACDYSVYAVAAKMTQGFVPYKKGVRIGLAGRYTVQQGALHGFCDVCGMVIRMPHAVAECSRALDLNKAFGRNILIVSPPFGGKTTFLRDLATRLSARCNVVVADERDELWGAGTLPLGECMVVRGTPKAMIAQGVLRALNPTYVVCDELDAAVDTDAIARLIGGGVHVVATAHAPDVGQTDKRLAGLFEVHVALSATPTPGHVVEVRYD